MSRRVGCWCLWKTHTEFSKADPNAFLTLLSSDYIIIVTDNIRLLTAPGLPSLLQDLSRAPSVRILVAERAPSVEYASNHPGAISLAAVKPDHAIRGLGAFSQGDINQYQKLLMESKIPQLAQQISTKCAELSVPSSASSSASIAVVRTAAHTARVALRVCEAAVIDAQAALSDAAAPLAQFKTEVSTVYPDAYQSALRGTATVREGVAAAEQRLRAAFARLPWYSLWWRADEVSGTLSEAVTWGSLGTQLAFHSGRLSSIRQQLYTRAAALATPSPVLGNKLAQIDSRTPVGPDALSAPLTQRTHQLLAPGGPVEDVHRKAQAAVMTTGVSILGSGAMAAGLFAAGSAGAGTAVGLGLLGGLASIRWMQSAWARAEKRWWADWARVCAGLERDCEVGLKEVVRERVAGSALAGIEGMEKIVARRAEIISALKSEVSYVDKQIAALEQRLK
ncbi:valine-tRNA ligase [Ceratobasidium sp. AG-Ba]|nr:valine-tRNA ligase [Ceratobasidium sp. AG-Ba]